MKRTVFILILLTLIFSSCKKEKKNNSGTFEVLTYNVAGLPEGISSSHPSLYTSSISRYLDDNDIVNVQEDFCYHDSLLLYDHHLYRTAPVTGCPQGNDGLNSFSKFPVSGFFRVPYADCAGIDCYAKKGFTYAQVDLGNGAVIDLYNTHAQASSDAASQAARSKNIVQLCAFIAQQSAGKPVILMGDFNSRYTREGDTIRSVLELGFKDTWVELIRNGDVPAIDSISLKDCDPPRTSPGCERVDKIFYRSGGKVTLTPTRHQLDDGRYYFGSDTLPLSDHYPMFASFKWQVAE